ncbi:hypothetical protein GQ54DRAFT_295845 [Martensiomyces pterosporus]|nr:hypothetical protein GQ54DRAFT_295845 [Martensiomyces pterosporus]
MNLPGRPQVDFGQKTWQVSVPLKPGACTVVDWASSAATEDKDEGGNDDAERNSDESSESDSENEDGGGYSSVTSALPPAIANDPFFSKLLRNAEIHEANERQSARKQSKRQGGRRRTKEAADDMYDLDDPFIDDSELTFMDGHNHTKKQARKKRRRKEDGNATEGEAPGGDGKEPSAAPEQGADAIGGSAGILPLEDMDKYDEDDFFVYYGPLNEMMEGETDSETFETPAKKTRSRKRPEGKQKAKGGGNAHNKRRPNGAANTKADGADSSAKKKQDHRGLHRRSSSDSGSVAAVANSSQIPSNGRKSGARTSRKLDPPKRAGAGESAADTSKPWRPPVPDRDKTAAAHNHDKEEGGGTHAHSEDGAASSAVSNLFSNADSDAASPRRGPSGKAHPRRAGTPSAAPTTTSSVVTDDTASSSEARLPTPEIESALAELSEATQGEAFSNRQRFPSSLKPPLRQVCELSMARALEYDRGMMSVDTPEHKVFAWSTPLDLVGFAAGIYHRLSHILPYNRATVRKIVSKLLGRDLVTWKERQLKQIEEGLKARIDDQIERGLGWIPVTARAAPKDGDDAAPGASQVRWHWTTLSKHILYQYMVLTLNMNELRNHLSASAGKDGAYREQQARKDAYAHLVNLWPGTSMSTYEISRAYSSRKSLLEKQHKKADGVQGGAPKPEEDPTPPKTTSAPVSISTGSAPAASADPAIGSQHGLAPPLRQHQHLSPEPPAVAAASHPAHHTPATISTDPMPGSATFGYVHDASPSQGMPSPRIGSFAHRAASRYDEYNPPHFSGSADMAAEQASPTPSMAYNDGPAGRFSSPAANSIAQSHRSLNFSQMDTPPLAPSMLPQGFLIPHQTSALDEQVRGHASPYYSSHHTAHPHQQQYQQPPQQPPQLQSDDQGSPGSSRYSMSVRNLTSP